MTSSILVILSIVTLMSFTGKAVSAASVSLLNKNDLNQMKESSDKKTVESDDRQQQSMHLFNDEKKRLTHQFADHKVKSLIPSDENQKSVDVTKYGRRQRKRAAEPVVPNNEQQSNNLDMDRLRWQAGYNILYPW